MKLNLKMMTKKEKKALKDHFENLNKQGAFPHSQEDLQGREEGSEISYQQFLELFYLKP